MARLRGQDDLSDIEGRLAGAFNAVTLKDLSRQYAESSPRAGKVLTDFYLAAEKLQQNENEFNRRAKPARLDLKANLRSADHFQAIRTFRAAKDELIGENPELGRQIAQVVEKSIAAASRPAPAAAKRTARQAFRPLQPV